MTDTHPASTDTPAEGGAVAWRWRYKGTDWRYSADKPAWPDDEDEVVQPLYLHPAPIEPGVREKALLDRLEAAEGRIEQLQDTVDGLNADLRMAVQVAYRRGATEWARLNYPRLINWLQACDEAAEPNPLPPEPETEG